MLDDAEYDELFNPAERRRHRRRWGTTNIPAVQRAIRDCDLQFLADHLRNRPSPGREVCRALADLLAPRSSPAPDQQWRLTRKRLARGRPTQRLEPWQIRIILAHHKMLLEYRANRKKRRGLKKWVTGEIAAQHCLDEKTVRNLLKRAEFREPETGN